MGRQPRSAGILRKNITIPKDNCSKAIPIDEKKNKGKEIHSSNFPCYTYFEVDMLMFIPNEKLYTHSIDLQ